MNKVEHALTEWFGDTVPEEARTATDRLARGMGLAPNDTLWPLIVFVLAQLRQTRQITLGTARLVTDTKTLVEQVRAAGVGPAPNPEWDTLRPTIADLQAPMNAALPGAAPAPPPPRPRTPWLMVVAVTAGIGLFGGGWVAGRHTEHRVWTHRLAAAQSRHGVSVVTWALGPGRAAYAIAALNNNLNALARCRFAFGPGVLAQRDGHRVCYPTSRTNGRVQGFFIP